MWCVAPTLFINQSWSSRFGWNVLVHCASVVSQGSSVQVCRCPFQCTPLQHNKQEVVNLSTLNRTFTILPLHWYSRQLMISPHNNDHRIILYYNTQYQPRKNTYQKSRWEIVTRSVFFFRLFRYFKKLTAEEIHNFLETNENPIMLHIKLKVLSWITRIVGLNPFLGKCWCGVTGYLMMKHIITKQIPESLNHLCITQVNRDLNQFYM